MSFNEAMKYSVDDTAGSTAGLDVSSVRDEDVLNGNEITEDAPEPQEPSHLMAEESKKKYYLVWNGRETGCFGNWPDAFNATNKHKGSGHEKYKLWADMWAVWRKNCLNSKVRGPLHKDSLVPMIVSREEIKRRKLAKLRGSNAPAA